MKNIESTNDFVIRFANVNGSGSASANNLFAKAVFRMGVPVSPKNIFPSNIQGLPTWYEVRINEQGYLGRHGDVDMVVAMNGQTMKKDYEGLLSGGYFFYDSSRKLSEEYGRDDVALIGIPLTKLCNDAFENPKMRGLLKNIIYVGALAFLLDMEFEVLTSSVEKQYRKKSKLIPPNLKALELGYAYAGENYRGVCKLAISRRDKVGDAVIMDGNAATGLGALYGGATVVGWYPITPSTSVIESFGRYAERFRKDTETGELKAAIVQAEDELAALGIVIGASWNGARAFTATSGPGVSLMSEFLGLAYFAEIPAVLVNVQRTGPSTGMPTRTQQGDILACGYASHGDTKQVLLFPCNPKECFDMTADAFDLAERLQTPVIVMSDLDLGMNDHMSPPLDWDDSRAYDRGKVLDKDQLEELGDSWGRYLDVDGDGIGYRTYPGTHPTKGSYFTRGTSHDEYSKYTEESDAYEHNMQRLLQKWETAKELVPVPEVMVGNAPATAGMIYYGTSTDAALEAVDQLREQGITINTLRIKAFPFQQDVENFIRQHDLVYVVEQNRDGQMKTLLINELDVQPDQLVSVLHYDGMPITARIISSAITASIAHKGGKA
ncbi:2-oxoacid:acceptor oxidoreductase subunit alpha [Desulfogranum marinum]|uniref:2-oxoacid:acceptor oxidoreductase subunit alpha n=1 Tax=Desulfogranum marinum TaxID=453220 RepID=UPI001964EC77|nr:2-oxoacid:acceptor oxidoreductase subunit alpha [Desulfogranum marinum]MBM9512857.1 2-oxoacid:acceptor oxidoreductase subunit alpha [Desulfogranum marinum]